MALTKLTQNLIDGTIVTSVNGSSGAVTLETGTDWQATPKTANFTAVAGEGYFVDTTSTAITVTLPSSPSTGDEVSIIDYGLNAATNNITITSSDNIEGAADDLTLSTDKVSKTLVYSDATKGWLVATEAGASAPVPVPDLTVDYLVVAGGGGGGYLGGGGGAGGLRSTVDSSGGLQSAETALNLATSTDYNLSVGAGGNGDINIDGNGGNGSNSVFASITSTGGGGGGSHGTNNGASGGSGGGGSSSGVATTGGAAVTSPVVQGFAGGNGPGTASSYGAGGGGGANSAGGNGTSTSGGNGGSGDSISITNSPVTYAGGGGGGSQGGTAGSGGSGGGADGTNDSTTPSNAAANKGGGGGGGGWDGDYGNGSNGGSGVVILRYPDAYDITVGSGLTTGQLNTAVGSGEKYTTFTGGTGTITFS